MKKDEKFGSAGRTILTRSTAALSTKQETPGLRRSNRGAPSKSPLAPASRSSSTRRSERLASSPASVTEKSVRMEKKTTTSSPLQRSDKGKNVLFSEDSKGSDKSGRNAETSSGTEESKDGMINSIEESTDKVKEREPMMTGRSYRAMCSRRILARNADALKGIANSESKRLPVGEIRLEKGTGSPLELIKETEKLPVGEIRLEKGTGSPAELIKETERLGLDASPMVEIGDGSLLGSPSKNSETQEVLVCKNSLETDVDFPLKRKRDTEGIVLDAPPIAANADDRVMSSDVPSPSGCKDNNQPEMCSNCNKRQKVDGDFENLTVCTCNAQPVQEPEQVAQDVEKTGPATSRDDPENRQNLQQDKSHDPKLSSMYQEFWVPVQLSEVQLEQYCRTLFSKSLSLSSPSRSDLVGALEETLTSVRKTCDHPYVADASLKPLLNKNLEWQKILDVEVKASGKLHLLDAMLTQIKKNGLKAVVFYQATQSPGGLMPGNILEDFLFQRFGQNSYEHGVVTAKKNAINNFNKESQCFVLLLETRACSHSIKLLRAEAFILFGSNLNPSQDVKLLEKIKIESFSERTKIFRLYSTCTVEEKSLNLARQNKPIENLNRSLIQALLMWGASYLFDKLEHFHGRETPGSGVPFEQSIMDSVIHEFSSILSSKVGEENKGKLCLLLEAKHAQGSYSTNSTLLGEEHVKLSDEESPNIFWTKLLRGRNPMWKYGSDTPQRSRKRIQYLQGYEEIATIDNGGNKKRKKASDDVTLDFNERKTSGKDHMGALNGNDAVSLNSVGSQIFQIPKDMLAGTDRKQLMRESQKTLHAVLKPDMAKLCQVLHLSEGSTSMVEKFLGYVIENHRVCKEPATTLQAFQIALTWIATSFAEQKLSHGESLACAKSELAFNCCREEVDYIYSMLHCMKSLFLERTQGLQLNCFGTNSKQSKVSKEQVNESLAGATVRLEKNNIKLMRNSEGEECMTENGRNSSVTEDIEKALSYIKKKSKNRLQNLKEKHEEKKLELVNTYADEKQKLENEKTVEGLIIRIQCKWTSAQSLEDGLKRLDHDHEKKIDEITRVRDEGLTSLKQTHEAEKKKLAEDEACWICRVEKWAQAELINCAPIKSASNKHFSGICSSNTSKTAPDVQTCNDASREAAYADTNCMVSKGDQVPEAENTLGTMSGGSTQQVREMEASRNDKAMDIPTLSGEKLTDNAARKILIPAGCQEESAALNVPLSKHQIYDKMTSVAPDEDVPSRVPEISKSFANLASPEFSLNREEAMVTTENNTTIHVGSDSDNILDQQNEEACSLEKEIPNELVFPMHPASVVETRGSTESDEDDLPSSPAGKQPDPAANIRGQNKEAGIEPQQAGSRIPSSPTRQQPDQAANNQGRNKEAAIESLSAGSLIPSSPAGQLLDPVANNQGQTNEAAIEPQPAESPIPCSPAGQQPDQAANNQGQTIEASTEPQPAGSPIPSPAGQQPEQQENIQGQNMEAVIESQSAGSLMPSSPAGQLLDPVANKQGQTIEVAVESQSSPSGQLLDPVANNQGQTIEAAIEPQPSGSETIETGGFAALQQADEVACLLPSSPTGNQHGPAATIEGQNINTSAELHIAGLGAVEIGDSAVSNQERTGAQDACSLLSSLVGTQADLAANTEGQNITRVTQLHTAGSDAVEIGGSAVSDQAAVDASHVPFSSPGNPTTESDACEMEIAEPGRQVEQSTFANNVAQLVRIGGVEPSASVTAPVPSLLNNGAGQSAVQPVPQVPFPQFTDPFQYELEKLRRESENVNKTFEEKTSILRAELERKLAEVRAEYQRKFHEVEVEKNARETEVERTKNIVIMNKLLGNAFLSKCTTKIASHPSEAPRGRIQQLALRAGLVTALRNYTASPPAPTLAPPAHVPAVSLPPAPLQRQASAFPSSVPRTSGLPLNSAVCPMPQPRQPLVSSPAPSFSASPATNLTESARPPHLNSYRSSSSIPIPTSTPTSLPIAQALSSYATLLLQSHQQQRQQHQQNLGIGLQQLQQNLGLGLQQQQQQQHQHQQSLGSGLQQNLGVGLQQQQQQQHQQSVGSGLQQNLGIGLQQQQQQQQQQHQQSLGSGLQQLQQNLGSGLQGPNRNDDVVCLSDDE